MSQSGMTRMLLLLLLLAAGSVLCAQQKKDTPEGMATSTSSGLQSNSADSVNGSEAHAFRIRVLDGRTAMPVASTHIKLWYDEPSGEGITLTTNARGVALMPAPIGQPIRILVRPEDAVDCRHMETYSAPRGYSMAEIEHGGVAAENTCGSGSAHTSPGEFVLFVRPARWYEKLNRDVAQMMLQEKVAVGRVWPIMPTYVRVTVGTPDEMKRFQAAFHKVMNEPVVAHAMLEEFDIPHELNRA